MLFKCYKSLSLEQFKGTMTLPYSGLKMVLQIVGWNWFCKWNSGLKMILN